MRSNSGCLQRGFQTKTVPVAVKRIAAAFDKFYKNEVEILRKIKNNNHIVKYFATDVVGREAYIAIELGIETLEDCVKRNSVSKEELTRYIRETGIGLQAIHQHKIIHRDIKPSNILIIAYPSTTVAKITDFGISKQLQNLAQSTMSTTKGTLDWLPPEVLLKIDGTEETRFTFSTDIFSFGLTMFYTLSNGGHPFGGPVSRTHKIIYGEPSWDLLDGSENESNRNLISAMLVKEPKNRPNINVVLKNPVFFSPKKNSTLL